MELRHPIDQALRDHLRSLKPNNADLAAAIGRSPGWVNKYMHGGGNATIDDVVRILALLIGTREPPLSELEQTLLKAFRKVPQVHQADVTSVLVHIAKEYLKKLPRPTPESDGPAAHIQREAVSIKRGRR